MGEHKFMNRKKVIPSGYYCGTTITSKTQKILAQTKALQNLMILNNRISNCGCWMSKEEDQKKPTDSQVVQHLNLKVKSQDGQEVFFKIKSTTQLKKLMESYCQRQGLATTNVRFLFDGERLHEAQTPKQLNMENGDEIDVLVEQVGGMAIL